MFFGSLKGSHPMEREGSRDWGRLGGKVFQPCLGHPLLLAPWLWSMCPPAVPSSSTHVCPVSLSGQLLLAPLWGQKHHQGTAETLRAQLWGTAMPKTRVAACRA